jgi:hypothetical protein
MFLGQVPLVYREWPESQLKSHESQHVSSETNDQVDAVAERKDAKQND